LLKFDIIDINFIIEKALNTKIIREMEKFKLISQVQSLVPKIYVIKSKSSFLMLLLSLYK